jgi:hypothetical protein
VISDRELVSALSERAVMARLIAVGLQNRMPADDPIVLRQFDLAVSLERAAMDLHMYTQGA